MLHETRGHAPGVLAQPSIGRIVRRGRLFPRVLGCTCSTVRSQEVTSQDEDADERTAPDPEDNLEGYEHEQAESETLTHDPVVDPGPSSLPPRHPRLHDSPRGQRSDEPQRQAESPANPLRETEDDKIMTALKKLLNSKRSDGSQQSAQDEEWGSTFGPKPGLKWRGGAAPTPPSRRYDKEDVRAWSKFQKKVDLWTLQATPYMSRKEMSLALYSSLQGELEQELEHMPLSQIHHEDGINTMMAALRQPMEQKFVYQKRNCFTSSRSFDGFQVRLCAITFRDFGGPNVAYEQWESRCLARLTRKPSAPDSWTVLACRRKPNGSF